MGFEDDMARFDEEAEEAKGRPSPGGSGGPMLKDGRHQVIIAESRIEEDTQNDRYSWMIQFRNTQGSIRKFQNLDNQIGREIAIKDAALLGYDGPLSGLKKACEDEFFIGLVCEVGVKTKAGAERDYTNVYVNRCLGTGDLADYQQADGDAVAVGSVVPDDDIPF